MEGRKNCSLSIMVAFVNKHAFTAGLYLSHLKRGQTVCVIGETKEEWNVCGCLKFHIAELPAEKARDTCSPLWEAARMVSMVETGRKVMNTCTNLHLWLYIFNLNMYTIVALIMLINIVFIAVIFITNHMITKYQMIIILFYHKSFFS